MKSSLRLVVLIMALAMVLLSGCMGPVKKEMLVEIAPNETAYVISLEGDTQEGQAKFSSVEFLEEKKVAAKRISLNQRKLKTGRGSWKFKWIPTEMVIKVDRAPVSREWTSSPYTGTNIALQAFDVESINSIGFGVGSTITAMIEEDNTSKFLYKFSGKNLADILDSVVRNRASDLLAQEFGTRTLNRCREEKKEIFLTVGNILKEEFSEFGMTITQFGIEGGLLYENGNIQTKIDAEFEEQNQIKLNEFRLAANEISRKDERKAADNKLYIAKKYAQALEAEKQKTMLEVQLLYAQATLVSAEKGNQIIPNWLSGSGSENFIFQPPMGK